MSWQKKEIKKEREKKQKKKRNQKKNISVSTLSGGSNLKVTCQNSCGFKRSLQRVLCFTLHSLYMGSTIQRWGNWPQKWGQSLPCSVRNEKNFLLGKQSDWWGSTCLYFKTGKNPKWRPTTAKKKKKNLQDWHQICWQKIRKKQSSVPQGITQKV